MGIFRNPSFVPYMPRRVASGKAANAYTLTIDSGSYALAGTSVALTKQNKLPVGAGAYALTGSAVGLAKGNKISVGSGIYTLTGNSVALSKGNKVPVAAGSYALTGTAVALKHGYPISVAAGVYSLTGTAVALRHASNLSIGAGAYSLAGTSVALSHGYKITVAIGSYALTGTAVALRKGNKVPVGIGSYALSGTAVTLVWKHVLAIGAGAYALTGTAVAMRKGPAMSALAGAYALSGTAVALLHANKLPSLAGSYALSGQNVGLAFGRKLSIGAGSFALSGQPIAFRWKHATIAGPGTYLLTGQSVDLIVTGDIPDPPLQIIITDRADGNGLRVRIIGGGIDDVHTAQILDTCQDNWRDVDEITGPGNIFISIGPDLRQVLFTRTYWVRVKTVIGFLTTIYSTPELATPTQGYSSPLFPAIIAIKHEIIRLDLPKIGGTILHCLSPAGSLATVPRQPCAWIFQPEPETVTPADNATTFFEYPIEVGFTDAFNDDWVVPMEWWLHIRFVLFQHFHRSQAAIAGNNGKRFRITHCGFGVVHPDTKAYEYRYQSIRLMLNCEIDVPVPSGD